MTVILDIVPGLSQRGLAMIIRVQFKIKAGGGGGASFRRSHTVTVFTTLTEKS